MRRQGPSEAADARSGGHDRFPGAPISLRNVTRHYRQGGTQVPALVDVDLDVRAGESVAVVGPSGSGKSTLLHVIGAMDRPDSGTVQVGGTKVEQLSRRAAAAFRRGVGFVFQHYHLLPQLSALDNVVVPLMPIHVTFDRHERARELLDAVGLGAKSAARVGDLSGGEQQRVAIARALVARPKLLLADEPTGALDSRTGDEVLDLLAQVQSDYGMTLILATHEAAVAAQCSRLVSLRDGAVVADHALWDPQPEETLRRATGLG
ncbi:putative ABC transport system ATP-binding protein [Jiangella mangrovi]|uniref:Putative ABC transport system ATP-binding protein n=1 Tax=Jiangella mangrovi TaxID=1524084 RepID=A0A7W9LNQ8_9ACTN|nr:ABC transporter ATP-binding protein [Jiangella mangrovi]MBB5790573.1 putative ABC transport system ATP-binding protein [Jiangella mangrovi]